MKTFEKNKSVIVRPLKVDETDAALQLAWKVFTEYESPDYAPEGTEEFKRCLNDDTYLDGIGYYGAFDEKNLVGVLGIREERCHICFFFVEGAYHRQGVGTKLFRRMLEDHHDRTITLNSSPYGLPFYEKLGFLPTEKEKTVNGIRFTPMKFKIEKQFAETVTAGSAFTEENKERCGRMNRYIAFCGLNCKACQAYEATINNDNVLREQVAKLWSELNGVKITPEMINCEGCRQSGVKTPYCDSLCPIRQCALEKKVKTCGDCVEVKVCKKADMILGSNEEARRNLNL